MDGTVLRIQRFSIHDGPGIRTTVFLKGCTMKCVWCHNPESIHPFPELQVFPLKCIQCGRCVAACPVHAHHIESGIKSFQRESCTNCGKCAGICCSGALEMAGGKMSAKDAVDQAARDKPFYEHSGGGVTFSGGEPLLQLDFLKELLIGCKKRGLHTAVETAGNVAWESFEEIIPFTDLFLFDMKGMDKDKYMEFTGSNNERSLDNLKRLIESGYGTNPDNPANSGISGVPGNPFQIQIRMPVVPGFNDTVEDMRRISAFIQSTNRSLPVELLPFHRLGEGKYESLGLEYQYKGHAGPTEETINKFKEVFKKPVEQIF